MVTFRFYVVSLVAFFLALAVGVLVGSVLDGRIADGLQTRLDGVEASLDETVAAIDAKNTQIDDLERYIEASAPFAVAGTVEGTTALVVAESGVDDAAVQDQVRRLREGGAAVEGIVWLEPRFSLRERGDLEASADVAGTGAAADAAEVRAALWGALLTSAGVQGVGGSTSTTTTEPTTTAPTTTGDQPGGTTTTVTTTTAAPTTSEPARVGSLFESAPIAALADAGLVRLQVIDAEEPADGGELVLVAATGLDSTLADPGRVTIEAVRVASEAGVPSVLAEVTAAAEGDREPVRGSIVERARESGSVRFSTVDDLELIAGRVAAVLALDDLRDGIVGRYGYGPDVDGVLPAWRGP